MPVIQMICRESASGISCTRYPRGYVQITGYHPWMPPMLRKSPFRRHLFGPQSSRSHAWEQPILFDDNHWRAAGNPGHGDCSLPLAKGQAHTIVAY